MDTRTRHAAAIQTAVAAQVEAEVASVLTVAKWGDTSPGDLTAEDIEGALWRALKGIRNRFRGPLAALVRDAISEILNDDEVDALGGDFWVNEVTNKVTRSQLRRWRARLMPAAEQLADRLSDEGPGLGPLVATGGDVETLVAKWGTRRAELSSRDVIVRTHEEGKMRAAEPSAMIGTLKTQGETCPLCESAAGMSASAGSNFVVPSPTSKTGKHYSFASPPLHKGCDCAVEWNAA